VRQTARSAGRETTRRRRERTIVPMTRQRYIQVAAATTALGGAAWVTKVAVLAATDGADSGLIGLLWLVGFFGMTLGASWIGVRLAGDRHIVVAVLLGVLTALLPFMTYDNIVDPLAESVVGDAGPAWFAEEAGILAAGVIWLAASLPAWLGTTSPARSARSTT
jgi:hypothetical protein